MDTAILSVMAGVLGALVDRSRLDAVSKAEHYVVALDALAALESPNAIVKGLPVYLY
jgi:hypothetical protein